MFEMTFFILHDLYMYQSIPRKYGQLLCDFKIVLIPQKEEEEYVSVSMHRDKAMWRHKEKMICTKQGAKEKAAPAGPLVQHGKKTHFCCVSQPGCANLSWQP